MDSPFPISELHIYSFFLSRLGSAVIIECTRWIIFLGHRHKWVVQRMADLLPHTQPPAPALGMLVNNSETETPSTLTRLSTTDVLRLVKQRGGGGGGGGGVFHRKSWITSHIHLLRHLVRPQSHELNPMILQYVRHRARHHQLVRMPLWLLVKQQPKVYAHLLGVNVAK